MSKNLIILLIIGAVFIFVLGGGLGVLYQTQKDAPQIKKSQAAELALKGLTLKVVQPITAYGQVSKVEGRNVTLTSGGESLTIRIKENASIFSSVQTDSLAKGAKDTITKKIGLKDVRIGDNLIITMKLFPDGQLEGQTVAIIPVSGQNQEK